MTSIERTASPRLKRRPSSQELAEVYTPTVEDLAFIRATARGPSSTLTLTVLLKVFQRLGHLPRLQDEVMDHPADMINVAIEDLVRQRFELPASAPSLLW